MLEKNKGKYSGIDKVAEILLNDMEKMKPVINDDFKEKVSMGIMYSDYMFDEDDKPILRKMLRSSNDYERFIGLVAINEDL